MHGRIRCFMAAVIAAFVLFAGAFAGGAEAGDKKVAGKKEEVKKVVLTFVSGTPLSSAFADDTQGYFERIESGQRFRLNLTGCTQMSPTPEGFLEYTVKVEGKGKNKTFTYALTPREIEVVVKTKLDDAGEVVTTDHAGCSYSYLQWNDDLPQEAKLGAACGRGGTIGIFHEDRLLGIVELTAAVKGGCGIKFYKPKPEEPKPDTAKK